MTRDFVATLLALTVALAPRATGAQSTDTRDVTFEEVQSTLVNAGYDVGTASWWTPDVLSFRVDADLDDGPTNLWVFIYPTSAAARDARRVATAEDAERLNHPILDSDDRGPQLLTGFGASYWWRNIAVVQKAEPGDANAWPVVPDYPIVTISTSSTAYARPSTDGMSLTIVNHHFIDVLESAIS